MPESGRNATLQNMHNTVFIAGTRCPSATSSLLVEFVEFVEFVGLFGEARIWPKCYPKCTPLKP